MAERFTAAQADAAMAQGDEALTLLHTIATQLQRARAERGAITFRRPELKIRVQGDEIHVRRIDPNSPSHIVVSEMMVLANGLAADFASVKGIPVIFRTQEPREAVAVESAPVMVLRVRRRA